MPRWYDGFAPVTATVDCDGAEHCLTWKRGKLKIEDHDAESERALVGLGGEPPLCLEIEEMWDEWTHDPFLLGHLIATIGMPLLREDLKGARERVRTGHMRMMTAQVQVQAQVSYSVATAMQRLTQVVKEQLTRHSPSGRRKVVWGPTGGSSPYLFGWRNAVLSHVPSELRRMIVAQLVHAIAREWNPARADEFAFENPLDACARGPFERAYAAWLPMRATHDSANVSIKLCGPRERASLEAQAIGAFPVHFLRLPITWLGQVWARGIAEVDGCFVLDVLESRNRGTGLRVRALRWEPQGGHARPVVADAIVGRLDDGGWVLGWLGA